LTPSILALLALSCAAEAPPPSGVVLQAAAEGPSYRPAGSPDVLILSVSGHCFDCFGQEYNDEYMLDRGTPQAVAAVYERRGLTTAIWDYGDAFYTWVDGDDDVLVWGWLDLVAHLRSVERRWMRGFVDPTRIVVVAHSHGTVWAHSALWETGVPVETLIDLDGVCLAWEDDSWSFGMGDAWMSVIDTYTASSGEPAWFDLANGCDSWSVPGVDRPQDIKEVVPDSARLNLEVTSSDWLLYDANVNWRADGTYGDIYGFSSEENHSGVLDPQSDAMRWVVDALEADLDQSSSPWSFR